MSSSEPSREFLAKIPGAEEGQRTSSSGILNREVAETNICKRPEFGENFKIGPESRVEQTHVNLGSVQDEPITPFRCLPKLEKNNSPMIWQIFFPHQPMQHPYEEIWIKVLVAKVAS